MTRYEIHESAQLQKDQQAALGQFIVKNFEKAPEVFGAYLCEQWAERAWGTVPSIFHYAAYSEANELIGQQSAFRLSVPSNRVVFGLGDLVVKKEHRNEKIGKSLIE